MIARKLTALLTAVAATALPAAAATATPGGATPDVISVPGSPGTFVRVGNPLLTARANGVSIAVHATAMLRGRVRLDGRAAAGTSGVVRIERLDARRGWIGVASAAIAADGAFHALWRPDRAGTIQLRAVVGAAPVGTGGGAGAGATSAEADVVAPQVGVTVYRSGLASWYGGPGMTGASTACEIVLGPTTLGVAHRTLPCGTPVALYHRGRTLVVPVIDRGPFMPGRSWDLTLATFRALGGGDGGLMTLGALALLPAKPNGG